MSNTTITKTDSGVSYKVTTNTPIIGSAYYTVTITDPDGTIVYDGTIRPGATGNGQVATSDGFSMTLMSGLTGGTYIIPAGLTGAITVPVNFPALSTPVIYVGGTVTLNTLASLAGKLDLQVDGGMVTLASGIAGSFLSGTQVTLSNGGIFTNDGGLIDILSGVTINFARGGGTFIVNGSGAAINLSSVTITNYDPQTSVIEFAGTDTDVVTYSISASGDKRSITLYDSNGNVIGNYTVTLASGVSLPAGNYNTNSSSDNPLSITYSDGNTYIGLCFLAGVQISTPDGNRAVETIQAGDMVHIYVDGQVLARPVTWVGMSSALVRADRPDDLAGYPVRILKDALAENVPSQDLLVTPEHCLYFEGKFVPSRMLVNNRSIFYDKTKINYEYFHIETECHSVIIANNTLTESYLDTGNRITFRQSGKLCSIGGRVKSWRTDAAGMLDVSLGHVEPIFKYLEKRAIAANVPDRRIPAVRTRDCGLHLIDDAGRRIGCARRKGSLWLFMIPAHVRQVRLVSRIFQPSSSIGPFVDDRRVLGVLVGQVTLFGAQNSIDLTPSIKNTVSSGWDASAVSTCRWTRGDALLSLEGMDGDGIGVLSVEVLSDTEYLDPVTTEEEMSMSA